jgi:hypothetical protein
MLPSVPYVIAEYMPFQWRAISIVGRMVVLREQQRVLSGGCCSNNRYLASTMMQDTHHSIGGSLLSSGSAIEITPLLLTSTRQVTVIP